MEVILLSGCPNPYCHRILHVCGGDPKHISKSTVLDVVFSTYVEVIPSGTSSLKKLRSILHVCGGDPKAVNGICMRN